MWTNAVSATVRDTGFSGTDAIEEAIRKNMWMSMFFVHLRATEISVLLSWLADDWIRYAVDPTVAKIVREKLFQHNPELVAKYGKDPQVIPISFHANPRYHDGLIRVIPYLSVSGNVFRDQVFCSHTYRFDSVTKRLIPESIGKLPDGVTIYRWDAMTFVEHYAKKTTGLLH